MLRPEGEGGGGGSPLPSWVGPHRGVIPPPHRGCAQRGPCSAKAEPRRSRGELTYLFYVCTKFSDTLTSYYLTLTLP